MPVNYWGIVLVNNLLVNFNQSKRTWQVDASLPISFTIHYSKDIFDPKNHDLINYSDGKRSLIICDETVYDLYGEQITNYFTTIKQDYDLLNIGCSEANKTWNTTNKILEFFEENEVARREPIIAIGGGVLLDIVGFACSIFRRGIPYIKIPTTLLAIVDASVGVKVATNHFERRNRLGAYYPPIATLIDKKFVKTQDEREIVNGLAEIFKLAVIKSEELFDLMEENSHQLIEEKFQYGAVPVRVINLAITEMIEELSPNLWEKNLDRCVDFGHTFSPLIEMRNMEYLLHGEAVTLDCLFSSCIAYHRNLLSHTDLMRIFNLAKNLKLPTRHPAFMNSDEIKESLSDTMKHRNNKQRIPVPVSIGNYKFINDLSEQDILKVTKIYEALS
jgi:3-dehydroquinate synthase